MIRRPPRSTLFSLHDALPILRDWRQVGMRSGEHFSPPGERRLEATYGPHLEALCQRDRKSTRLNSSHSQISYAVFCLKKKKRTDPRTISMTLSPHIAHYRPRR